MVVVLISGVVFSRSICAEVSEDFLGRVQIEIKVQISERLQIPQEDVTVHYLGINNANRCNGASYVKVEIPIQEDFRGKTLIYLEGWKDNALCGRWTVQGDIEIWSQIPTAKYAVQAGEVVEIDWRRGRLDQVREPLFVWTPTMEKATLVAVVPIGQAEPLKQNHVRRKADFEQGAPVVVIVQKGALEVRVQGTLLRSSYVGDTVKVRSQSSNTILEGRLTENGMVLLK